MKDNSSINRAIKQVKKMFQPKTEHEPPCSKKDASKKRKAKIRMQKQSRIINRKAS